MEIQLLFKIEKESYYLMHNQNKEEYSLINQISPKFQLGIVYASYKDSIKYVTFSSNIAKNILSRIELINKELEIIETLINAYEYCIGKVTVSNSKVRFIKPFIDGITSNTIFMEFRESSLTDVNNFEIDFMNSNTRQHFKRFSKYLSISIDDMEDLLISDSIRYKTERETLQEFLAYIPKD